MKKECKKCKYEEFSGWTCKHPKNLKKEKEEVLKNLANCPMTKKLKKLIDIPICECEIYNSNSKCRLYKKATILEKIVRFFK